MRIAYDNRIFLILDGKGCIRISDVDHTLSAGVFIFIPPEIEYCFHGKMKVVVLNFDITRSFQDQRKALMPVPRDQYDPSLRYDLTRVDGFDRPLVFTADSLVRDDVMRIVAAFTSKSPFGESIASATLKKLISEILDNESPESNPQTRLIERILLYVRSNAAEISDNEQVAKEFGYHPIYISSLIKKKTGKSLHRTIIEERIRLACRFLRSTDGSIEQIAFDTGFSSRNHFCTVFRSIVGVSPLTYRKK